MVSKKANSRSHFNDRKNQILKSKRSQSQLITSVLIILLVIGGIILVGTFMNRFLSKSTDTSQKSTDCFQLDLEISKAVEGEELKVIRGTDDIQTLQGVRIFLDGEKKAECAVQITAQESKSVCSYVVPAGSQGKKIQIAKLVGSDYDTAKPCNFDGESADGNPAGYQIRDGVCSADKLGNCDEGGECAAIGLTYAWNSSSSKCYLNSTTA